MNCVDLPTVNSYGKQCMDIIMAAQYYCNYSKLAQNEAAVFFACAKGVSSIPGPSVSISHFKDMLDAVDWNDAVA